MKSYQLRIGDVESLVRGLQSIVLEEVGAAPVPPGPAPTPTPTPVPPPAVPGEIWVSPTGSDSAEGTRAAPWASLAEAVLRAAVVHVLPGTHKVAVALNPPGDLMLLGEPGASIIEFAGFSASGPEGHIRIAPGMFLFNKPRSKVLFDGLVLDGGYALTRCIRVRDVVAECKITNCEVRRWGDHALDLDATDVLVEDCHIHHILRNEGGLRVDAHGIVTVDANHMVIRRCEIHKVSGDCWQGDVGKWNLVEIEDCDLYDHPLEQDAAGFTAGQYTTENCIDTKHAGVNRGKLIVRRTKMHGIRSVLTTSAALVLKESVDVLVDSCEVYDCLMGFRVRGHSDGKLMFPAIINNVVRNCDLAVRHEDRLANLKMAHNTFTGNAALWERAPKSVPHGPGWDCRNNLFDTAVPAEVLEADQANFTVTGTAAIPKGIDTTGLLPDWTGMARVDKDKAGKIRDVAHPTAGALE